MMSLHPEAGNNPGPEEEAGPEEHTACPFRRAVPKTARPLLTLSPKRTGSVWACGACAVLLGPGSRAAFLACASNFGRNERGSASAAVSSSQRTSVRRATTVFSHGCITEKNRNYGCKTKLSVCHEQHIKCADLFAAVHRSSSPLRASDLAMMADCVGFQAQIASIIEILANSAVAEICKLVDDGYAALRSQMEQEREKSEKENDALRQKVREMDLKMRSYERKMRRRSQREEMHVVHFRPPEGPDDHQPLVPPLPTSSEDKPFNCNSKLFFAFSQQEETKVLPLVKQEKAERDDCNLDLKVEVNIRAECGPSTALEPSEEAPPSDIVLDTSVTNITSSATQPSSSPTDTTMDLTCRPRAKRRTAKSLSNSLTSSSGGVPAPEAARRDFGGSLTDGSLKPEIQADDTEDELHSSQQSAPVASDEPSPDRLNSLGLDLAWMQERVSHLGAAYAVAQLGLGNTETGHPAASFPSQGGGDSLDGPPTMLFTGGAHEMAAFAASFDMAAAAAAAAAVAAPPPPPPSHPTTPSVTAAVKEPMVCAVCGRVFPSAAALELHQRVHTGERPYTCPHCGKGFAQPNNLRVHLLIHTGERRYRCTLCGKSFISSSHLKRHRTVHTQEKPYSCSRCGQSFSQMCSVRRHRQQSQCGL